VANVSKQVAYTGWPKQYTTTDNDNEIVVNGINLTNKSNVNDIKFIRQIKVWIKYYNTFPLCMRDLLSDLNNYTWPANYASDTVNDVSASSGISSL